MVDVKNITSWKSIMCVTAKNRQKLKIMTQKYYWKKNIIIIQRICDYDLEYNDLSLILISKLKK